MKEKRQSFIEIIKWAQKWKGNQTDLVSFHSVAIQQTDGRL